MRITGRAAVKWIDDLFNKHQLVRRCSIVAAWTSIVLIMLGALEMADKMQAPAADVLKTIILGCTGVVMFYHYRRP